MDRSVPTGIGYAIPTGVGELQIWGVVGEDGRIESVLIDLEDHVDIADA